jgi:hypothetical protein
MKQVVFSRFLGMVDTHVEHSFRTQTINFASLSSRTKYISVGTHSRQEIINLLLRVYSHTQFSAFIPLGTFENQVLSVYQKNKNLSFKKFTSTISLPEIIEKPVHGKVKMAFYGNDIQRFETDKMSMHCLKMKYHAEPKMPAMAGDFTEAIFENIRPNGNPKAIQLDKSEEMVSFIIKTED